MVHWLYILPGQGEDLPVKTGIHRSSGGSGHGVNSKDILDYQSCQLAGHTKQTTIIHAHCVMIKAHLKAPLLKCYSGCQQMPEKPTCLEKYVCLPRGVGTADTTTLSTARYAFKSTFPTAVSLCVTVSLAHVLNHLHRSAVIDHGFFIVIIMREKEETFLKASAFLSSFGQPSFTLFLSLSEAKDFGSNCFLLQK